MRNVFVAVKPNHQGGTPLLLLLFLLLATDATSSSPWLTDQAGTVRVEKWTDQAQAVPQNVTVKFDQPFVVGGSEAGQTVAVICTPVIGLDEVNFVVTTFDVSFEEFSFWVYREDGKTDDYDVFFVDWFAWLEGALQDPVTSEQRGSVTVRPGKIHSPVPIPFRNFYGIKFHSPFGSLDDPKKMGPVETFQILTTLEIMVVDDGDDQAAQVFSANAVAHNESEFVVHISNTFPFQETRTGWEWPEQVLIHWCAWDRRVWKDEPKRQMGIVSLASSGAAPPYFLTSSVVFNTRSFNVTPKVMLSATSTFMAEYPSSDIGILTANVANVHHTGFEIVLYRGLLLDSILLPSSWKEEERRHVRRGGDDAPAAPSEEIHISWMPYAQSCPYDHGTECGGHGFCEVTTADDSYCVCNEGWASPDCAGCAFDCYFNGSTCVACPDCGHGRCNSTFATLSGDGSCVCNRAWAGVHCDVCDNGYHHPTNVSGDVCAECPGGHESPCHAQGDCRDGVEECLCENKWDPASNCSVCLGKWDEATDCQECRMGYWGPASDCLNECPGGHDAPCNLHGECDSGTGICTCEENYRDDNCGTKVVSGAGVSLLTLVGVAVAVSSLVALAGLLVWRRKRGSLYARARAESRSLVGSVDGAGPQQDRRRSTSVSSPHVRPFFPERSASHDYVVGGRGCLNTNHDKSRSDESLVPPTSDLADLGWQMDPSEWIIDFEGLVVESKIAAGGQAQVYRGRFAGQLVAVKELFSSILDPESLQEFRFEATTLSKLHHPHIVRFYGVCENRKHVYIVTEFCPRTLGHVIEDKVELLTVLQLLTWARQIALALAFMHSRSYVHRDLKPENVLIDDANTVKVCDFGLAKLADDHATMTGQVGSVCYMPPELMSGGGRVVCDDARAVDVYAFAMVLWAMCARRRPYKGINQFEIIRQVVHKKARPPISDDWRLPLRTLIEACWAIEPADRPTFGFIQEQLAALMADEAGESADTEKGAVIGGER